MRRARLPLVGETAAGVALIAACDFSGTAVSLKPNSLFESFRSSTDKKEASYSFVGLLRFIV